MVYYIFESELKERKSKLSAAEDKKKSLIAELNYLEIRLKDFLKKKRPEDKTSIEKLQSKKKSLESSLGKHVNEINECKRVVENCVLIEVISVDLGYECKNGFFGLSRDLVMKLLLILDDRIEIKKVIGMGHQLYLWKDHNMWKWVVSGLSRNYPVTFLPKPQPNNLQYLPNPQIIKFWDRSICQTVSIDCDLVLGRTFILELILNGIVYVGVALKTLFPLLHKENPYRHKGTALIVCTGCVSVGRTQVCSTSPGFWEGSKFVPVSLEWNASSSSFSSPSESASPSSSPSSSSSSSPSGSPLISSSASASPSASTSTLSSAPTPIRAPTPVLRFYANSRQIPHTVTHVPGGVCFILASSRPGCAEVRALHTVRRSLAEPGLRCVQYKWSGN